jgi:hypothetical protein
MQVNLYFQLEERDTPTYCHRVNAALKEMLNDKIFTEGLMASGQTFEFLFEDSLTKVIVTYNA